MAGLPDLDVARLQRWCAARVPEGARHQVYVECQRAAGPHDRGTASTVVPGQRARVDELPDRATALRPPCANLDAVRPRPEHALSHLRPIARRAAHRCAADRDRSGPDRHLLGVSPPTKRPWSFTRGGSACGDGPRARSGRRWGPRNCLPKVKLRQSGLRPMD